MKKVLFIDRDTVLLQWPSVPGVPPGEQEAPSPLNPPWFRPKAISTLSKLVREHDFELFFLNTKALKWDARNLLEHLLESESIGPDRRLLVQLEAPGEQQNPIPEGSQKAPGPDQAKPEQESGPDQAKPEQESGTADQEGGTKQGADDKKREQKPDTSSDENEQTWIGKESTLDPVTAGALLLALNPMVKSYLDPYRTSPYDPAQHHCIGDQSFMKAIAEYLDCPLHPATDLNQIYESLQAPSRTASYERKTRETDILIHLNLDGNGYADLDTGIGFFDHMLHQLARHGGMDLIVKVKGDLEIDEHHTIEDVALALGTTFDQALGDKKGIQRYGFLLPMDDCLAQVAVDFGGRPWCVWEADFKREMVGQMPTEMFFHFFKSFSDTARCNLNIKAEGENEHHKIESIYKAWARAIRMAVQRTGDGQIPSTKGTL